MNDCARFTDLSQGFPHATKYKRIRADCAGHLQAYPQLHLNHRNLFGGAVRDDGGPSGLLSGAFASTIDVNPEP